MKLQYFFGVGVFLYMLTILNQVQSQEEFCYHEQRCGPATWPGICQRGRRQSPLDLPYRYSAYIRESNQVDLFQSLQNFSPQRFNLTNNGNTIVISLRDDMTSTNTLEGTLLRGRYVFSHLHFHWGSSNDRGSEHTVNRRRYPMEAHLVHYSSDYNNIMEAIDSNRRGAIAVIGVFFKISSSDNQALSPIIRAIRSVRRLNERTSGQRLRLSSFFNGLDQQSNSPVDVIQYHGSLTTPMCNEIVLWNVIAHPAPISSTQMEVFRTSLLMSNGRRLVNNYRATQNRNGRDIAVLRVRSLGRQ